MPTPLHRPQPLTHPDDLASRSLMTYDQAAEHLCCSRWTVARLVKLGRLRACKYLGKHLISSRALCEFIDRAEGRRR